MIQHNIEMIQLKIDTIELNVEMIQLKMDFL